jgi:hypothetical protein
MSASFLACRLWHTDVMALDANYAEPRASHSTDVDTQGHRMTSNDLSHV